MEEKEKEQTTAYLSNFSAPQSPSIFLPIFLILYSQELPKKLYLYIFSLYLQFSSSVHYVTTALPIVHTCTFLPVSTVRKCFISGSIIVRKILEMNRKELREKVEKKGDSGRNKKI